jgi:hypothetical protein
MGGVVVNPVEEDHSLRWRRNGSALWRSAPGPLVVVLPPGAAVPLSLTGPGAQVWAALAEPRSLDDLVEAFVDAYDAGPAVVRHDIGALVRALADVAAVVPAA